MESIVPHRSGLNLLLYLNPFSFSIDSFLNEGMTNFCNSAIITYNSGGPLVIGIDLLFKRSDGNVIKVIEKLDKANLGLVTILTTIIHLQIVKYLQSYLSLNY
jgi:hypothetical protein